MLRTFTGFVYNLLYDNHYYSNNERDEHSKGSWDGSRIAAISEALADCLSMVQVTYSVAVTSIVPHPATPAYNNLQTAASVYWNRARVQVCAFTLVKSAVATYCDNHV